MPICNWIKTVIIITSQGDIYARAKLGWSVHDLDENLKGTVSRDFSSPVFFIKQLLMVLIGMPRIFSNIRGFIRIRNRLPGYEYTGESIRIPKVRQFLQTKITCP